ncbi:maltose permease [Aspergillus sclerotioniger CBS 115572]|uniref:Maltose permease n=1 Tax=Aspergillus sclerotioniger CBS 115572 TaxID=1450535 RepID=A0A317VUQ8_9EURO|nr:maltose permease [Aspergillus sclerotioniger CBS 115572]PWY78023.1 maltose permease [Aspergillus sclerotioniger CBS 115572]
MEKPIDLKRDLTNDVDLEPAKLEVTEGATTVTTSPSLGDQFRAVKYHKRAVLAAFACSTTPILIGYDLTLIGSIIANTEFVRQFGVYDHSLQTWLLPANYQLVWSIVQYVSAIVTAICGGYLNDIFGRRVCFLMTVLLAVCGTFVELFSSNWKIWIVAKIFMGSAMGSMQCTTQTYVSEITPTSIRGLALSLFQFWVILGQLIASCVLEGTSHVGDSWSWKGAVVSQFGPSLFCLVMFLSFCTESPYYLVSKDRMEDARSALARLRAGENIDLDEELGHMQATLLHERQARDSSPSLLECFQGTNLRRTLLACMPVVMQILIGYPLCGNYLSYFLSLSGFSNSFLITVISVVCSIVASLFAFVLIERVGRRRQMLTGCVGMLVCLLTISILGFEGVGQVWNYRTLAAFCIIWAVFYYSSVGAVGWAIVGEISSSRLRAKTTSIAALSSSLTNMVWSIAIPYLVNKEDANLGSKSALIFLGFGFILSSVCFFCLPETKGKSFARLDALFEARTPARRFAD